MANWGVFFLADELSGKFSESSVAKKKKPKILANWVFFLADELSGKFSESSVAKKKPKSSAPRENELSEKFPESSAAKKKPKKFLVFVFLYSRLGFFFSRPVEPTARGPARIPGRGAMAGRLPALAGPRIASSG